MCGATTQKQIECSCQSCWARVVTVLQQLPLRLLSELLLLLLQLQLHFAAAHFQFVFVVATRLVNKIRRKMPKREEGVEGVKEMPFCCNWLADTHPLYVARHLTSVLSGQFELPTPFPAAFPLSMALVDPHLLPFYQLLQIAKCLFGRIRLLFVYLFVCSFVLRALHAVVALCFVVAPQKTHQFFNNIWQPQNALWLIEIVNFSVPNARQM